MASYVVSLLDYAKVITYFYTAKLFDGKMIARTVPVIDSADEVKARKRIKAYDAKPDEAGAVDTFDAIDTIF